MLSRQALRLRTFSRTVASATARDPLLSPYRNNDGSLIKGTNAKEARLDDRTLQGWQTKKLCSLPDEVAKTINNNILSRAIPARLRERAAKIYQAIEKEQIQKAPETALDCDAFIGALFLQNYSHAHQILLELQQRVGKDNFNPRRVLDVGYGPATGIVALNDIMGPDWVPEEKEAYIVGRNNWEMKKRAKIILSRQVNELYGGDEDAATTTEAEEMAEQEADAVTEAEEENEFLDDYVGPIATSKIHVRTRFRDSLPVTKKYDLIMVHQSLLSREYSFPKDVDTNIRLLLRLLAPGGHIIVIERGNPLGFETVARARQIMIRPESHVGEKGKIPRPYIPGSQRKPQRNFKEDQMITDFEAELIEKYGEVEEDELDMEADGYDVVDITKMTPPDDGLSPTSVDYHLKIIAPCSHHGKCPLQLGDPKYFKIPSHKHRLNFCSFSKKVARPKFTMELKKGKKLALPWDKSAEDGFGFDAIHKKTLKSLEGSGRPGSNNTEVGSYSYVIAQRSMNDVETIKKIDSDRKYNTYDDVPDHPEHWPRIVSNPQKLKNNVKLTVCAPSGNIETWNVPKSLGKQPYHDARKVELGDLWALDKKGVVVKSQISDEVRDKLEVLSKTQKKTFLKEQRKKNFKKVVTRDMESLTDEAYTLADSIEMEMARTNKKRYKMRL
ncbi:hypothetical protein DIURU_004779 [Diutina rugosa]|uniref:TFIIS central domain-containing protein n=1 Tax=Diutina rugosa TaxID=5481 RepID=A0A642UJC0_DIURU|nr:uncharacterized protein DIURU_004779 [Diutina rugosa]KAA8897926.1 hypothetical protein DIURU_004779 [Diutina rugosa]